MRRLELLVTLAVVSLTAGLTAGEEAAKTSTRHWSVDDVIMAEQAADMQISPDSRWAVWTKTAANKDKGQFVANLVRGSLATGQTVELTRGTENCFHPRWSPDGKRVAFLSVRPLPQKKSSAAAEDKEDDEEEEKGKAQIWLIDPFGGEPWPITESTRGITSFAWAGQDAIVYLAKESVALHEKTLKEDKKDTTTVVDDEAHEPPARLFRLDINDKKSVRLTLNTDRIKSFALSPNGRQAVCIHERSLRYEYDNQTKPQVLLHDLDAGTSKIIFDHPSHNVARVRWAAHGKGFYAASLFTTHQRYVHATITELYYFDLESGRATRIDLGWPKGLSHTSGSTAPAFEVTGDGFVALLANGLRNRAARFRRDGSSWRREWMGGCHSQNIVALVPNAGGANAVYAYSTAASPTAWYAARIDRDCLLSPVRLTGTASQALPPAAVAQPVRWAGAKGHEVEGLLYFPKDYRPGRRCPLVVAIHGGPAGADLDAWNDSWHDPLNLLTDRGAFVLKPNYHGSSNYGLNWVESIANGLYYDWPLEDIEKGIDSLVTRGLVARERVAAMGWSNGAILTVALIVRNPWIRAASAGAGGAEWVGDWGMCEFGASFSGYYFGKSPLEDPHLYLRMAPFYQFDRIRTPTIFFHGTEDRAVPPHHGWMQFRALQQLGKADTRLVLFPGEPHSLRKLVHRKRKVEEEIAWFDKYLFGISKPTNEALKPDSPLAQAIKSAKSRRVGHSFGILEGSTLVPETVLYGGIMAGRFETTRAQYRAFDPKTSIPPGEENYPMAGITFAQARAYCQWLGQRTGRKYRLPTEDEAKILYTGSSTTENTLDYWAGYAVNPDDSRRLEEAVKSLPGDAPLLRPVGSFPGAGDEELIFDLGGNVAEWTVDKRGSGRLQGGSADFPAVPKTRAHQPSLRYAGFRVVRIP